MLLPEADRASVRAAAQTMTMSAGQVLYRPGDRIQSVYFPQTAVMAMVIGMKVGGRTEVLTIGKEGIVGVTVLLGDDLALGEKVCKVGGTAVRMSTQLLLELTRKHPAVNRLLRLALLAQLNQIVQHAACGRLHRIEERCARWILVMRDRLDRDSFPLKQDFLADMLGVRRASSGGSGGPASSTTPAAIWQF